MGLSHSTKCALEHFAGLDFEKGMGLLEDDTDWKGNGERVRLGFPGAAGWGEGVLCASLLKRQAVAEARPIKVAALDPVASILCPNHSYFDIESYTDKCGLSKSVASWPLKLLRDALIGDLLDLPFQPLLPPASRGDAGKLRIGIAFASVDERCRPIEGKSIPGDCFLSIVNDLEVDIELISFQRRLCRLASAETVQSRVSRSISDDMLDGVDQTAVVSEIVGLDAMVTISTTTAHLAGALGIPTVLLAANRGHSQWFWPVQHHWQEQGLAKAFYPHTRVVLAGKNRNQNWYEECLDRAREEVKTMTMKRGCRT
jgi:hypothetical protein